MGSRATPNLLAAMRPNNADIRCFSEFDATTRKHLVTDESLCLHWIGFLELAEFGCARGLAAPSSSVDISNTETILWLVQLRFCLSNAELSLKYRGSPQDSIGTKRSYAIDYLIQLLLPRGSEDLDIAINNESFSSRPDSGRCWSH